MHGPFKSTLVHTTTKRLLGAALWLLCMTCHAADPAETFATEMGFIIGALFSIDGLVFWSGSCGGELSPPTPFARARAQSTWELWDWDWKGCHPN